MANSFFFSPPLPSQLSWSKAFVRKWFNIKSKAQDFHSDDVARVPCSASLFLFCSSRKRSSCCLSFQSDAHYRMQNTVLLSPFSFFLPIVCFFSGGGGEEWRGSLTGMESYSVKKSKSGCSELSSSLDIILPLFVSLPLWPQIDCPRRTLIKLGGEERSILMQLRSLKPCIIGSNLTHPFAAAVPDYH
ncbi:hypothetical protein GW17_00059780 [Ensete ventricosum]|uniref:Uncharacterized protein n=1 Tax=Ensete ventricosum TaxID=4639 RepID=A0A426X954_ENSVE|nr:hypothetical protein B296_00058185 [Ensete ventricosum]RWV79136.1 hypothetical protein GW17_00059780 [Ensete ventricosum]